MKKHPDFRAQVQHSSYLRPDGNESLQEVVRRWGDPFGMPLMYAHMKRHQLKDIIKAEQLLPVQDIPLEIFENPVKSDTPHEQGLDEFIAKGRQMLADGKLPLTASAVLKAISIKADIEKSTKDRRLDVFKTMKGAFNGPKQTDKTQPER